MARDRLKAKTWEGVEGEVGGKEVRGMVSVGLGFRWKGQHFLFLGIVAVSGSRGRIQIDW